MLLHYGKTYVQQHSNVELLCRISTTALLFQSVCFLASHTNAAV